MFKEGLNRSTGTDALGDDLSLVMLEEMDADHPFVVDYHAYETGTRDSDVLEYNLHVAIPDAIREAGLEELLDEPFIDNVCEAVNEAVTNAVKHGADFCQNGEVVEMEIWGSRKGIFAVVTDPGKGISLESIQDNIADGRVLPPSEGSGTNRGKGGEWLQKDLVNVSFEHEPERGFTVNVLLHT